MLRAATAPKVSVPKQSPRPCQARRAQLAARRQVVEEQLGSPFRLPTVRNLAGSLSLRQGLTTKPTCCTGEAATLRLGSRTLAQGGPALTPCSGRVHGWLVQGRCDGVAATVYGSRGGLQQQDKADCRRWAHQLLAEEPAHLVRRPSVTLVPAWPSPTTS